MAAGALLRIPPASFYMPYNSRHKTNKVPLRRVYINQRRGVSDSCGK